MSRSFNTALYPEAASSAVAGAGGGFSTSLWCVRSCCMMANYPSTVQLMREMQNKCNKGFYLCSVVSGQLGCVS